jgi:hypothetical protein
MTARETVDLTSNARNSSISFGLTPPFVDVASMLIVIPWIDALSWRGVQVEIQESIL